MSWLGKALSWQQCSGLARLFHDNNVYVGKALSWQQCPGLSTSHRNTQCSCHRMNFSLEPHELELWYSGYGNTALFFAILGSLIQLAALLHWCQVCVIHGTHTCRIIFEYQLVHTWSRQCRLCRCAHMHKWMQDESDHWASQALLTQQFLFWCMPKDMWPATSKHKIYFICKHTSSLWAYLGIEYRFHWILVDKCKQRILGCFDKLHFHDSHCSCLHTHWHLNQNMRL